MKQKIFIIGFITGVMMMLGCDNNQDDNTTEKDSTKVQSIKPKNILFTTPTVEETLPEFEDKIDTTNLQFNQDDWRQIEFISKPQKNSIVLEIEKIKDVYDHFSQKTDSYTAFKKVALRDIIKEPLAVDFSKLKSYLSVNNAQIKGVSLYNNSGQVRNGFSFTVNGITYYGVLNNNTVQTFCIHSIDGKENLKTSIENLSKFLKGESLYLIDWVRMKVIDENNIGTEL
jgi:hypothetical protein